MDKKVISFMPYILKKLPCSRKFVLELRMVKKLPGIYWKSVHVVDKTARHQHAKDDDDEGEVENENLLVTFKLEDDTPINKIVKPGQFNRTTKHTVYFDVDLNGKRNDPLMNLVLKQRRILVLDITFRPQFLDGCECDHAGLEGAVPHQISTIGSLDTTLMDTARQQSHVENLNEITDLELAEIAEQLGNDDDVEMVALKLGFKHVGWLNFSVKNRDGRFTGTRDMLFDWKKDTLIEHQRPSLRKALERSKFSKLAYTI